LQGFAGGDSYLNHQGQLRVPFSSTYQGNPHSRQLLQSSSTSSSTSQIPGISTSAGNGTVLYVPFGAQPPFSLVPCPNSSVPTSARYECTVRK
jgi:hypothetical protein